MANNLKSAQVFLDEGTKAFRNGLIGGIAFSLLGMAVSLFLALRLQLGIRDTMFSFQSVLERGTAAATTERSTTTAEVARTAQELNRLVEDLQAQVRQFTL